MRTHTHVDSPLGPLVLVDDDGLLAGVWTEQQRHRPEAFGDRDDHVQPALREQLDAYWTGRLRAFDVPLAVQGTPFQQRVWSALRTIPYGTTWSYGRLAAALGQPGAARAVGLANGRNPISVVVPCHRVVGASGSLTGYSGGLEAKRFLLDLEGCSA